MPIIRTEKTKDYVVMSNRHLRDKNLSLKSKGLLSVVLSLPDDWKYSINGLVSICKENETAIKSSMKELKAYGYLKVTKERDKKGLFEYVYTFCETPYIENPPMDNPPMENPPMDNPPMDNPPMENIGLLNIKELNTDILNTDILNIYTEPLQASELLSEEMRHNNPPKQCGEQSSLGVGNKVPWGNDNLIGVDNVHSNVIKSVDNVHTEKEIEKEIEKDINNIYTPLVDEQNPKPKKPPKHKYGEYKHVLLTDDEYKKLCTQYGEELTLKSIKYLDEYIEMKGYKAKSHYLCMKKWVFGAVLDDENKVNKVSYNKNQFNSLHQRNRSPEDMEQMEKLLLSTSVPKGD